APHSLDAPFLFLARVAGQARLPPVVRHLPAPQSIGCAEPAPSDAARVQLLRRGTMLRKVHDGEGAIVNTRDACAPQR
ncbi:MAG: hypothetical protein DME83_07430, partial [Verrucomicrobia bacterium]